MRRKISPFKIISFILILCILVPLWGFSKGENKSRFEELELFNKVMYLIETSYYREVDTKKLIEGAIKGMMQTLDPHSAFLGRKSFKRMQDETEGEYGGLGLEVTSKDGQIYIITPIEDTPAFKAGILPGDKIVEIEGEPTLGMTLQEAVKKMRGNKSRGKRNNSINLGIVRQGSQGVLPFTIKRSVIKVKPVKQYLVGDNFALIRLTQFTRKASSSIISSIKKLRKQAKKKGGVKGIILDLRSNPGGLLDEAVNVSSIFLKEGIVVSTEPRDPKDKEVRYVNKDIHKELDTPVVVLINGASASASEIVAGALQDYKRAIIMGAQSFGKGSVQQVARVDNQVGIKLTIAQYMTPKGRKIQARGIKPDVELEDISYEDLLESKKHTNFIREVDLKNHLNATIETPEEKKLRENKERKDRKKRVRNFREKQRISKKKKDTKKFKKYDPKTDYQVITAVNHLKSYDVIKSIKTP